MLRATSDELLSRTYVKGVSKSNHPPSDNLCNILTRERAKCRPNVIHHREERQTGATVLHEYSSSNSFANSRDRRIDFRLPIGNLGDASSAENSISSGGGALYVLASERRFMRRKCESYRRGGCRVASGNKGKSVAFPRGGEERGNERRGEEEQARNNVTSIALFLAEPSSRNERGGGPSGLMRPFA